MKKVMLIALLLFSAEVCLAQWEPDVRLTNNSATSYPSANSNARVIAVSGDTLHVVWFDYRDGNNEIYYKRSTDNGISWGADVRLTNSTGTTYDPCIAVSGSVVHVLYSDIKLGTEYICYKRSEDRGSTWGNEIQLSTGGDAESPSLAIDGSVIHVIWEDMRNATGTWDYEIYYKRSTDGGLTWGPDTRLTNNPSYSGYPGIVVSGSAVIAIWEDDRDGTLGNVYYKRSSDGGTTWGPDTRLSTGIADAWDPCIAVNGSVVHVVWMDSRDGGAYEVYYNRSTDGGITWGADTRLTNAAAPSEYPTIAVSGSKLHITWQDQRDINYEIYYKHSEDGGLSWTPDERLTNSFGNSLYPFIAVNNSSVHVVWEDERDGNEEIYYKRNPTGNFYVGIGNDQLSGDGKEFSIYPNPAAGFFHLDLKNISNDKASLSIRNVIGEEIVSRPVNKGKTTVDVSGLQNGLYFVVITTGNNKTFSSKLTILK